MDNDALFAPPTAEELAAAKASAASDPMFAPPTPEELAAARAPAPSKDTSALSKVNSAMRGAAQGGTLGFADELYGLVGGGINSVKDDKPFGQSYREARDYARGKDAEAQADNPKTSMAGNVAGALSTAFVPGLGVLNAGKGATIAGSAAKGALAGGLSGLGNSEADVTKGQLPQAAVDTAKGAALGGFTGGAVATAGKVLNPTVMRYLGNKQAFKAAAGNNAAAWDSVTPDVVQQRGKQLLDDGVVTFGANARTIADRAAGKANEAGQEIGNVLQTGDQAAALPGAGTVGPQQSQLVSGKAVADRLREYAKSVGGSGNKPMIQRLNEAADDLEARGNMSLGDAQVEKDSWRWEPGSAVSKVAARKVKGIIGDEMENGVAQASKLQPAQAAAPAAAMEEQAPLLKTGTGDSVVSPPASNDPIAQAVDQAAPHLSDEERGALSQSMRSELGGANQPAADAPNQGLKGLLDRYQAAKQKYGTMTQGADDAETLANRQDKNQFLSLGDKVLMAAAPGHAAAKIATGGVSRLLRTRGDSATAAAANQVANILEKSPESFGKYAPTLLKAAQNGQLPLVHYLLMKNKPDYAQMVSGAIQQP